MGLNLGNLVQSMAGMTGATSGGTIYAPVRQENSGGGSGVIAQAATPASQALVAQEMVNAMQPRYTPTADPNTPTMQQVTNILRDNTPAANTPAGGTTIPGGTTPTGNDANTGRYGGYKYYSDYLRLSGQGGGGPSAPAQPSYTAPTLPTATSQADYINQMYDTYQQQQEANLRSAYEANMGTLNHQAEKIPGTYDQAANQAAVQAAINRANFNESAAASGLNTGAGSQARLSQDNALLGNISSIRKAQADALSEVEFQRTQMETEYRNAINEAIAQNDLQRAQALYQEAKRVDDSIVNTAINQANLNWQVWKNLYG